MTLKENKQRTSLSDVCNGKHFLLLYPRTSVSGTSGGSVLFDLPELKEFCVPGRQEVKPQPKASDMMSL